MQHPEAIDDLAGIARWRLSQMVIEIAVRQTDEALEWLAAHDYLTKDQRLGSPSTFRLNPQSERAAKELLGEDE